VYIISKRTTTSINLPRDEISVFDGTIPRGKFYRGNDPIPPQKGNSPSFEIYKRVWYGYLSFGSKLVFEIVIPQFSIKRWNRSDSFPLLMDNLVWVYKPLEVIIYEEKVVFKCLPSIKRNKYYHRFWIPDGLREDLRISLFNGYLVVVTREKGKKKAVHSGEAIHPGVILRHEAMMFSAFLRVFDGFNRNIFSQVLDFTVIELRRMEVEGKEVLLLIENLYPLMGRELVMS